jgi:hypothetical protein
MPIPIRDCEELSVGDFYEDCAYHPCLCIGTSMGTVDGISLVDGSFPRNCGVPQCDVRKLTLEEAIQWRLFGPPDVPPEIEMTDEQKYWLKHQDQARDLCPRRTPNQAMQRTAPRSDA